MATGITAFSPCLVEGPMGDRPHPPSGKHCLDPLSLAVWAMISLSAALPTTKPAVPESPPASLVSRVFSEKPPCRASPARHLPQCTRRTGTTSCAKSTADVSFERLPAGFHTARVIEVLYDRAVEGDPYPWSVARHYDRVPLPSWLHRVGRGCDISIQRSARLRRERLAGVVDQLDLVGVKVRQR